MIGYSRGTRKGNGNESRAIAAVDGQQRTPADPLRGTPPMVVCGAMVLDNELVARRR